jgi:hypothetical protein
MLVGLSARKAVEGQAMTLFHIRSWSTSGVGRPYSGGLRRSAPVSVCRIGALIAAVMLATTAMRPARACEPGDEACPVVLRMARGDISVVGRGSVSGTRPNFYFKFDARAGQTMTVTVAGQNLKTGPGIPITLPNGATDAVDENAPYALPQSGDYLLVIHANTMSDGPFGPFTLTLTIK